MRARRSSASKPADQPILGVSLGALGGLAVSRVQSPREVVVSRVQSHARHTSITVVVVGRLDATTFFGTTSTLSTRGEIAVNGTSSPT